MRFHYIKNLKNKKYKLQKGKKSVFSLALAGVMLVATLTGCGQQKADVDASAPTYDSQVTTGTTDETTNSNAPITQEQYDELMRRMDAYENSNPFAAYVAEDTFTQAEWDAFVAECRSTFAGKINNVNEEGLKTAFVLFNIDYLDANAKQVLINHYSQGRDIEAELYNLYPVLSQVREYNTELTNADNYLSYTSIMKDEKDKAILSVLDGYAKEVITLRQDLKEENVQRIQEIFDIIDAFSRGTGTIKVTINGETVEVAQGNLSHGGIFAAENIAQDISVLCKDIVSQEKREDLDKMLNSRNTLAKTQEIVIKYTSISSITATGINEEEQAKVVSNFNKQLDIVASELEVMGVTREEAQALLIITNIDYFMDSANSQNAFSVIYKDGFDINGTFAQAEEAVRKIQAYDDTQAKVYDMARLVMNSEADALSLRGFTAAAHGIVSTDASVAQATVNDVKGYSQFSKDVTFSYEIKKDDGTTEVRTIDKNGISTGARQVINWYTYYTVSNHKTVYGDKADAILPLVDGSQDGLNPYDSIVLMVEEQCAENNIVIYNYTVGGNTK